MKIKQKHLIILWILIPQKTACYRNNVGITSTNFNWFNPLTYIYLVCASMFFIYLVIRYGKKFTEHI